MSALEFLVSAVRHPLRTASVIPSSRALARALAEEARIGDARLVAQLGVGTGVVTRELLNQLTVPSATLVAYEVDARFVAATRRGVGRDPRLILLHGRAQDMAPPVCAFTSLPQSFDAIVSTLGLALMPAGERREILAQCRRFLRPGGRFVAMGYDLARWRLDLEAEMREHFVDVRRRGVFWNLPPAHVYVGEVQP